MKFESLEQRMAQNFINMFAPFVPDENAPVSVTEQEQFYLLMKNLYQLAFDEPLLFVASLNEDDAYPSRYKKPYGKPKLILTMKKFTKSMDGLLQYMFLLGQGGCDKPNKRYQIILSRLGVENTEKLPSAWVWMSKREGAGINAFSCCLFDKDYPYVSDISARLLGESSFSELENRLLEKGYKRYVINDIMASDCKLSLTIANPKWSSEPPRGGFEYKIKHTGISTLYDPYTANPQVIGLCIPNGMRQYLTAFDSMYKDLQSFVVEQTKKCDCCRYCIQTDKTGARPIANIPVCFEEKKYMLCTYFPGYYYCWPRLDDDLVEKMMSMLSFMDRFAPGQAK